MVSLHCKGGKGRTGTMICAVLIDMGLFNNARDSLQYFGQRRTDLNVSQQFQGVETYSQVTTKYLYSLWLWQGYDNNKFSINFRSDMFITFKR